MRLASAEPRSWTSYLSAGIAGGILGCDEKRAVVMSRPKIVSYQMRVGYSGVSRNEAAQHIETQENDSILGWKNAGTSSSDSLSDPS